jgi:CheY-like chemotaxis protein
MNTIQEQTILLIEDEAQQRDVLQLMFESQGFVVYPSESAEKALAYFQQSTPTVVVTDVKLGGGDGISLFEKIRSENRYKSVPFIFITGYNDPKAIERVKSLGGAEYLTKPYELETLMTMVQKHFPPKEIISN